MTKLTSADILKMYEDARDTQSTYPECVRVFSVVGNVLHAVTSILPEDIEHYVETYVLKDKLPCPRCGSMREVSFIDKSETCVCTLCDAPLFFTKSDIAKLNVDEVVFSYEVPLSKHPSASISVNDVRQAYNAYVKGKELPPYFKEVLEIRGSAFACTHVKPVDVESVIEIITLEEQIPCKSCNATIAIDYWESKNEVMCHKCMCVMDCDINAVTALPRTETYFGFYIK